MAKHKIYFVKCDSRIDSHELRRLKAYCLRNDIGSEYVLTQALREYLNTAETAELDRKMQQKRGTAF